MKELKKPLAHTIWFKIILVFILFVPSYSQIAYDPVHTSSVIAAVLSHPLIISVDWLLPLTKIALLLATIIPFSYKRNSARIFLGYYAVILLIVGFFQNMAITKDYGFVWMIGNTVIQLVVMSFCIYDVIKRKTVFNPDLINKSRLWIGTLMLLAFLMPYAVTDSNTITPALPLTIFHNEAGVTYCMITPVIIGVLLLFSKGVHKPTLSIISFVGLMFGILNMFTWFISQNQSWWMGVLHLPLLILSFYGLIVAYKEKTEQML